jgi:hypothetical protein
MSEQQPDSLEGIEYTGMVPDAPPADVKPDDTSAEQVTESDESEHQGDDQPEGKQRSKRASQRIDELTRNWREEQRKREALEARLAALETSKPETTTEAPELAAPNPDDAKYEFGEADPAYLKDLARYEVKVELAEQRKAEEARRNQTAQEEQRRAVTTELNNKWAEAEKRGAEKYDDFGEKLAALQASPLTSIAISASPVAEDAAYHLASNPHESGAIEARVAAGDLLGAAEAFGAIEGQYLDAMPERPSGPDVNPLDLALYAGRVKAYLQKENKPKATPSGATNAPEPPQHKVRGASGQFEADWSSENADLNALAKLLR